MTEAGQEEGALGQVRKYLNNSGLPLELTVTRAFRPKLMNIFPVGEVQQRVTYETHDAEGLKIVRETDVVATHFNVTATTGVTIDIRLVIECKSSKDAPWIFYRDGQHAGWRPDGNPFGTFWFEGKGSDSGFSFDTIEVPDAAWLTAARPGGGRPMDIGAPSFAVDNTKTKDGRNTSRDAILQVLTACEALSLTPARSAEVRVATIPVIVTSAPMFAVIGNAGNSMTPAEPYNIELSTRELVTAQFRANDKKRAVWVFHESEVEDLAETFVREAREYNSSNAR